VNLRDFGQPWIPTAKRFGLLMRIAVTESVSLRAGDETLTAFLELEKGRWPPLLGQMTRVRSRSSRKLSACVISRNSSDVR
jgi:hypothetical protein